MTYSAGQLIDNDDYNGFVVNNTYNINTWWGPGSGNQGWGQTALTTVDEGNAVQASNWAGLVNSIQAAANHTGTAITARTAPVSGDTVIAMSNVNTDITAIYNSRGNAVASGTVNAAWTGSAARTDSTGTGSATWTLTWTNTVTFESADQARYFFNAGGLIRIQMNKSSTGTTKDSYWNSLVGSVGTIYISGGIGGSQTIGGVAYTGVSISGASGSYTYNSSAGWYYLLANGSTQIYQKYQTSGSYTGDYITVTAEASATALTITTTWESPGTTGDNSISGGSDTASPFTSFGTAPAVVTAAVPPSSVYLTNTWGSTAIAESVTATITPGPGLDILYAVVGGGGGGGGGDNAAGGGGGGGGGGVLYGTTSVDRGGSYAVVVGAGGAGGICNSGTSGADGANSSFSSYVAYGGSTGRGAGGYPLSPPNSATIGSTGGGGGRLWPAYSTTSGQGYAGGTGGGGSVGNTGDAGGGGGGGGATAAGTNGTAGSVGGGSGGNGGAGYSLTLGASTVVYGSGAGGGAQYGSAGTSGSGAGAAGSTNNLGTSGLANRGGGGGGAGVGLSGVQTGGGGSGIVVIDYASPTQLATGGTVTSYSDGGTIHWTHTFTSSGVFVVSNQDETIMTAYIAGGGGGGSTQGNGYGGGGGGANVDSQQFFAVDNQSFAVNIGSGGSGETSCQAGDQSAGTSTTFIGGSTSISVAGGGQAPSSSNCGDGSAGGGTSGAGWFGGAGSGFGPADGGGGGAFGPGGSVTQTLGGVTRVGPGTNYGGWGRTTIVGYYGGGGTRLTTAQIGSEVTGANWGGGVYGTPGTANTGGGGGGGGLGSVAGAAGGSGITKVLYQSDSPRATGGIISPYSYSGTEYWMHTFLTSGTFTVLPTSTVFAEYLVVAGGGGGRGNGNAPGGGGGVVSLAINNLASGQSYAVTVGAGGSADASGNPAGPGGTSSVAGIATSTGGIGGGTIAGQGGNSASIFYGTTTNYTGGTAWYANNQNTGAGAGAGAGANGETVPYGENRGGTGGIGYYASDFLIAGTDVNNTATTIGTPSGGYYGGGGGGGYPGADYGSFCNGLGGAGGGGGNPVKCNTGYPTYGQDGLTNTGGGGQGGSWPNGGAGGNGGSGIVVIRYAGTPIATGGTITQTGGYTYHVFTSSGTFTVS